ncbi:MAG TPA: winged helix-turn-helix domain-containing protein, partial [Candidatus Faecivivens stercoripullorum]|nr:winged helix-turn-helix domain-containing protein [Candidatus Faecivivens stercoripullorum]
GVWGDEYWNRNNNTIATHIRHLREKMMDTGDRPLYIRTVWGIGYRLGEG